MGQGETLGFAVGGQGLEILRPTHPPTESHPPGVAQPEERRAVLVPEVGAILSDAQPAAAIKRVRFTFQNWVDLQHPDLSMQSSVIRVAAPAVERILPWLYGGETYPPLLSSGPESRHLPSPTRPFKDNIHFQIVKRVGVHPCGSKAEFNHPIRIHMPACGHSNLLEVYKALNDVK